MFTALYRQLVSEGDAAEEDRSVRVPSETLEVARQNVFMFLSRLKRSNELAATADGDNQESPVEHSLKLLSFLDNSFDRLIDSEDVLYRILGRRYDDERVKPLFIKTVKRHRDGKIIDQINSLRCLFKWDLETPSNKDLIARVRRKYGDYNLDISLPLFAFEKYVLNVIIAYELFRKGEEEKAKIVLLLVGKWLEELDECGDDEFYTSMSSGLKHVLIGTLVHMKPTNNMTYKNVQELLHTVVHFFDMNQESKAAIFAIQAAVLIEYGNNKDYFQKAVKCTKKACNLNPTNSFWFYRYSLALTAHRRFSLTLKSSPNENETNAIQQALVLSNIENSNTAYHAMILFKDSVLYNFHSNKNNKCKVVTTPSNQHLCDIKKLDQMIKTLVAMKPKDPLSVVNCARILMNFPELVQDQNLGMELLTEGLQMAPNDLIVLKTIARVIIVHIKKTIMNSSSEQSQEYLPKTKKQTNLCEDLKSAVEKHNNGEDPLPYLLSVLTNYECQTQWKILAQISSYKILFSRDLKLGIDYFMMLVEAEQNGFVNNDLILRHYSSFVCKRKNFNFAELVFNEILLALAVNSLHDRQKYYNILAKIMYTYEIKVENADVSMLSNIIGESRNNDLGLNRFDFKNDVNQTVAENTNSQLITSFTDQHSNTPKRCRSKSRSKSSRNRQNSSVFHTDDNGDNDNMSTNSYDNSNKCCSCTIM